MEVKMQVSELVERSGVPLATVKFYIREGMLPPGRSTGARRAEYDDEHLERLRLIRSLTVVAGLPLARARRVLAVIDEPVGSLYERLGAAIEALSTPDADDAEHPYATAALDALGEQYQRSNAQMSAFAQLDAALRAAEEAGIPVDPDRLRLYGEHIAAIARAEVDAVPDGEAGIGYAVLATVLYEPVLDALRRLAHQNLTRIPRFTEGDPS